MIATKSSVFRFAGMTVREREFSIVKAGQVQPVEPKAFRVLLVLLRNPQKLITKEELLSEVWSDAAVTENSLTRAITLLRRLLGDNAREPRYIETVSTIGYRFLFPIVVSEETTGESEDTLFAGTFHANGRPKDSTNDKHALVEEEYGNSRKTDSATDLNPNSHLKETTNSSQSLGSVDSGDRWPITAKVGTKWPTRISKRTWVISTTILVVLGAIGIGISEYRSRSGSRPIGPVPLYVAEFTNSVGDPSFDYVLRDIAANELKRSPDVQVMGSSEDDLVDLLQKVGRGSDDSLTSKLARQLCEGAKRQFFTEGRIEPEGGGYSLELSVKECNSGRAAAQQRAAARNKDEVLQVASQLAAATRLQFSGKSANSSDNAPAPLPTASLEAYKTYLMGERIYQTQLKQSATMLRRAVELDPGFAKAWEDLSLADYKLGDEKRDDEDLNRAFALRMKLPSNEQATVEARYHWEVTGEIYKAIEDLQTLEKLRPNEFPPRNLLALAYSDIGMYEKATVEFRTNRDLFPDRVLANTNLATALLAQGHYDEAETLLRRIPDDQALGFSDHALRYELAMLRSDRATLEKERSWMDRNVDEPLVISYLARIDMCEGRLEGARQRTQHAVNVALQSGLSEFSARMLLNLARGEALYGQGLVARQTLVRALKLSDSRETKEGAVGVMVLNGQEHEAEKIMNGLQHEHPSDTFLNELDTPIVLASSQLASGQSTTALRTLDRTKPFEFGRKDACLSNYIRALAYLRLRRFDDATEEFGLILEHCGQSSLSPLLVASRLGLARMYALHGDISKSRAAYETQLAAWKNADSDIPIVKEANAEYARLRSISWKSSVPRPKAGASHPAL